MARASFWAPLAGEIGTLGLSIDLVPRLHAYASEMSEAAKKDPLHGKTLKAMLSELVERYGWEELASQISINCFAKDPSLSSSLKFLRKTPWARNKVEIAYLKSHGIEPPVRKKPAEKERLPRQPLKQSSPSGPKINPWTGKPVDG